MELDLENFFIFGGAGLITAGCWMISTPLALIVAGTFFMAMGIFIGLQAARAARNRPPGDVTQSRHGEGW